MNDAGKRRFRVHVLFYRRGETPEQDTLVAHRVGRMHSRGHWRVFTRQMSRWAAEIARAGDTFDYAHAETEDYYRERKAARCVLFLRLDRMEQELAQLETQYAQRQD